MSDITLSKAVRQNLHAMQSTAKMMSETQNHLATGKKVNSALDNPTNFFTASSLDARAGDLNSLMDNVGNAVQTLEAADNGIKAIQKLVESAEGTAKQALQAADGASNNDATGGSFTQAAVKQDLVDTDKLKFQVEGSSEVEVTFGAADVVSIDTVAAKISADVDGVTATVTGGKMTIKADADDKELTVTNGTGSTGLAADLGFVSGTESTNAAAETFADSDTKTNLEAQFKETLKQIDALTKDASFNGNNFLSGDDLKVTFNETGTSSMTIKGADTSASGLGLSDPASGDFQDDAKLETLVASLGSAKETLRSQASTFGSNLSTVETRKDFTQDMINTLQAGAANLTMTDMNQEGANMLALQTRSQLATTALSMASQADQSVLRLL